jgi:Acetyltransferases
VLTLAVRPSAQGRGLGGALLSAVETAAATLGATRMILEVSERNAPARGLYARAGYAPLGRRRGYFDGVDALVLFKEISTGGPVAKP